MTDQMSSLDETLAVLQADREARKFDGERFEAAVLQHAVEIPSCEIAKCWHYLEWPERTTVGVPLPPQDAGIDLVAVKHGGSRISIQCKARSGGGSVTTKQIQQFAGAAPASVFAELWMVAEAHRSAATEDAAAVAAVTFVDFETALADALEDAREQAATELDPRTAMQQEAVAACVQALRAGLPEHRGNIDAVRLQTLAINIDKAKGRIREAVKQAYCIVVTVSEKNEIQAFKINVTNEPHFNIIKNDLRSRVQDCSIAAEALLPNGPYNLWCEGETSRRVKDLSGAFAQLPHLPKMLKTQTILDTLTEGCAQGSFVLRLTRPDGSFRTWWRARSDETTTNDPALELVLPAAAVLAELPYQLLVPRMLPELWIGDEITMQTVLDYFNGKTVVQVSRDGYTEPVSIPKAGAEVVNGAITAGVEAGALWLTSGPASVLAEPIPAGVLTPKAILHEPPAMIAAAEILPENLADAWSNGQATALSIATALSQRFGYTMPWKTVKDVITASINARFTEMDGASGEWPCEYPVAQSVKLNVSSAPADRPGAA